MKRTVYLFLALCLLASCKQAPKPTGQKRPLTKLEQLYRTRPDSAIFSYDLSNCGISEFPDLSRYTIKSLNLSGNPAKYDCCRPFASRNPHIGCFEERDCRFPRLVTLLHCTAGFVRQPVDRTCCRLFAARNLLSECWREQAYQISRPVARHH